MKTIQYYSPFTGFEERISLLTEPQPGSALLDAARKYVAAGISLIPISTDGSKRPWTPGLPQETDPTIGSLRSSWKPLQRRLPTENELRKWYDQERGLAFICGEISNGLECLDFDEEGLLRQFIARLNHLSLKSPIYRDVLSQVNAMPLVETPSSGHHLWYRCPYAIEGNQKLAMREANATMIETRGEGGYAIAPPSPASCHPDGKPYDLLQGDFSDIPVVTSDQRTLLLNLARSFNLWVAPERVIRAAQSDSTDADRKPSLSDDGTSRRRPGDDFNQKADWSNILEPHGWEAIGQRGQVTDWRRPGKQDWGLSGTTNYGDSGLLYVFSSNAYPFDQERGYDKFAAFALLNCNGDFRLAAGQLRQQGYGDQDWQSPDVEEESVAEETGGQEQWEEPVPLGDMPRPTFPLEALPSWLGRYVHELAEATQTPPDASGMLVLAACATAAAKRLEIEPLPGWREPLNLFVMVFLPPGSRKSEVLRRVIRPILSWQGDENERRKPLMEAGGLKQRTLQKRLEDAEKRIIHCDDDGAEALEQEMDTLREELVSLEVPKAMRLVADDVSPERLVGLLQENDGRMAILSAEGGLADMMQGRYSSNTPDIDVYLKGHAGDDIYVDRIGRPYEHIQNPALTIGLAVQPEIMRGLLGGKGFKGRGLLGRLLYAFPQNNLGYRDINPKPMTDEALQDYAQNLQAMLSMEFAPGLDGQVYALWLAEDAKQVFDAYRLEIEDALRPGGEFDAIQDWAGKLAGATARIAGLLHLAEHARRPEPWGQPRVLRDGDCCHRH